MNTKAEMNFQLILFLLAGFFLVSAAFVFVPNLINTAKETFEGTWFDFTDDTIPEQVIDEERIDAEKEIPIDKVESDSKSGYLVIVKQEYGQGWNLESAFYKTFTEDIDCPWYWSDEECAEARKSNAPLLSNQKLEQILASEEVRGKIEINGGLYFHLPQQHDFQWFEDKNNNEAYDEGEDISTEDLTKIILADLYTQATEE